MTEKQKIKKILESLNIKTKSRATTENLKEILKKTKQDIDFCVSFHETHKKSFFWSSPKSATARRHEEQRKSFTKQIGKIMFVSDVQCSCSNYYYTGQFFEGSEKKNVSCFKKYQKMIEEINS